MLHGSASPCLCSSHPPPLLTLRFFGNSNTPAVKRPGSPAPQTGGTVLGVSTYCFLCLFSSLLLLFGLEELKEKRPINERCKMPVTDKKKQVVKMLNTQWPPDPGNLGTDLLIISKTRTVTDADFSTQQGQLWTQTCARTENGLC